MSEWFRPIRLKSRTDHLQTFAKNEKRGVPLPILRGARIVDIENWPYPRAGVQINFMGKLETLYTTRDWMKIFDIDKSTVYKWQKIGLIPEPLFTKESRYKTMTRFYVRGQLRAVALIVNDLRRQGILRFRKETIKHHLEMIVEGNKVALDKWHKAREGKRKKPKIRWREGD